MMISLTIPKILFNGWFWMAIATIIIVIHHFLGKTPPLPKPSKFFTKHKKSITKIMDVCIICFILAFCLLLMSFPVRQIFDALHAPQPIQTIDLHFAWETFFINMTIVLGPSGVFIGLLSVFQSDITKIKRLILLIVCLLPLLFTIIALIIEPTEEPWSLIKLGLGSSFGCWLINGPAIIIGKHFFRVSWAILRALHWVSEDYPG